MEIRERIKSGMRSKRGLTVLASVILQCAVRGSLGGPTRKTTGRLPIEADGG